MRKISVKAGVTALFALALFAFSFSQEPAQGGAGGGGGGGGGQGPPQVDCSDPNQSIQAAVDIAVDGDTIEVSGTCTEIVTITTDGITIRGDPVDGGTLIGEFIVNSAVRVVFDNMTVKDGTNHGVLAQDGASVRVINLTITNHPRDGVFIDRGSNAVIEGSTITNNGRYAVIVASGSSARLRDNPLIQSDVTDGPRTLLDPFNSTTLGVFHNSFVRLLGGNLIENTGVGGRVVEAAHSAVFRQQFSLDTIVGSRAINIFNGSVGELRGEYEVTGRVDVGQNSSLRLSKRSGPVGVIDGLIRVRSRSTVEFGLFTLKDGTKFGSVTVNGRLDCGGGQGRVVLGGGQTIQDVFPSQFNRENSQCNDFNGNVVLPVFGPE